MKKVEIYISKNQKFDFFQALGNDAMPTGLVCATSRGLSLEIAKAEPSLCDRIFLLIDKQDAIQGYLWIRKNPKGYWTIMDLNIIVIDFQIDIEKNFLIKIIKDKYDILIKDSLLIEKLLGCSDLRISNEGVIRSAFKYFESFELFRTFDTDNILFKSLEHRFNPSKEGTIPLSSHIFVY